MAAEVEVRRQFTYRYIKLHDTCTGNGKVTGA